MRRKRSTIVRFVDLQHDSKDKLWLLLYGSFYDTRKDEIVIGLNHPLFRDIRRMLLHEIKHMLYEKFYKPKASNFLSRLYYDYIGHEIFILNTGTKSI